MEPGCYAGGMTGNDITHRDTALLSILASTRTIAVVGASPNPTRAAHGVMRYLQGRGYHCLPVNPNYREILAQRTYPALADTTGEGAELIDVFRNIDYIPGLVDEILALPWQPKLVFLQEGLIDDESMQRLMDVGIDVVQDRCLYKEHWRLIGIRSPRPDGG